jgi:ArsR family transcriptional regulator
MQFMLSQKIQMEAALLAVLAQPTRLKILYFLHDGEKCACEINPHMQEDASVISRHLVKMKEAGLLDARREGVSIYYRIIEPRVFDLLMKADEIIKTAAQEKARRTEEVFP